MHLLAQSLKVKSDTVNMTSHLNKVYLICVTTNNGYRRVYLPLYKVIDTPYHIQEKGLCQEIQMYLVIMKHMSQAAVYENSL